MLDTMKIGDLEITRLIVGSNPFIGKSHLDARTDADMREHFSDERAFAMLRRCEEVGINAVQSRGSQPVMGLIHRYRETGGKLHWLATSGKNPVTFDEELELMLKYSPSALCIHGELSDELYLTGNISKLRCFLDKLKMTGLPVGICSHFPEVLAWAEENGLSPDFYMASLYNLMQPDRSHDVNPTGARFEENDIPKMFEVIRKLSAPTIALKILGAGRRCADLEAVRSAFIEAFAEMKKGDGVLVGMFDKYEDQPLMNAEFTAEAIRLAECR